LEIIFGNKKIACQCPVRSFDSIPCKMAIPQLKKMGRIKDEKYTVLT
jgi:hypothetical protein